MILAILIVIITEIYYRKHLKKATKSFYYSNSYLHLGQASINALNIFYILFQHVVLIMFFTIYFDRATREDSFALLFVLTL